MTNNNTVTSRIEQYHNARVTVQYGGSALGMSDTGTVTYMNDVWVEITKERGERLLIPVVSIRHIKLLDGPKLKGDATTLLRPVDAVQTQIEKQ